jgi:hypothetical protein
MTYHVRGLQDFYVKGARIGPDHGVVCQNEAISDMRVALRMARIAMEADLRFVPRKVLFPFLECQNCFFVRQLPKQQIKSWTQHPT